MRRKQENEDVAKTEKKRTGERENGGRIGENARIIRKPRENREQKEQKRTKR